MKYRILHETVYTYEQAVTSCQNEAHLVPRNSPRQRCLSYKVEVVPRPGRLVEREDFFGNRVTYFAIDEPHDRLVVTATSEVSVDEETSQNPSKSDASWPDAVRRLHEERASPHLDAYQYLLDSPMVGVNPNLREYAAPSFEKGGPVADVVQDLMVRIFRDFTYDPGFTTIATPLSVVLEHRRGVCQDFAHLAIGCLRSHGIPARYVSGYLETEPPPGNPKLRGADASHAWLSVYDPACGWRDYDPTNNQLPNGRHITTAWGRDYSDVTPLKGIIYAGGRHQAQVAVDVIAMGDGS
jgi:transglutaminase-like putative cysteine protease